jgi:hypothetical protein
MKSDRIAAQPGRSTSPRARTLDFYSSKQAQHMQLASGCQILTGENKKENNLMEERREFLRWTVVP